MRFATLAHDTNTLEHPMEMKDCPRYTSCNAPLCPLDPDWRLRAHAPGESVCIVLMEHVKPGADERFASRPVMAEIRPYAEAMLNSLREEKTKRGELAMGRGTALRQVEASPLSGSSFDKHAAAGQRLRASRQQPDTLQP